MPRTCCGGAWPRYTVGRRATIERSAPCAFWSSRTKRKSRRPWAEVRCGSKAERLAVSIFSPVYPHEQTSSLPSGISEKCHVWTAPGWQEESSRRRLGRCSHVFGLFCAVHVTAGHNALRRSGPGQKPAFENAVAHVGCPDRRIDRLCITCCSPSQPSHHARVLGAISLDPQRGRIV